MNYYNEWDPQAAAWLRELIENKLIPEGVVDERSITEVQAKDLKGFTQCHFFAGIGGWPLALQLTGIPATTRLWTGSPHANRSALPENSSGNTTPDTLRPSSSTSSASAALQSCLGNKLRQQLQNRGCAIYKLTWREKTTPSGLAYSQLVASARRTNAIDFSSARAGWPTVTTIDNNQVAGEGAAANHPARGTTLGGAVRLAAWPTPTTRDHKDGKECPNVPTNSLLGREVWKTNWPTPRSADGEKNVRTLEGALSEIQRKGGPQDVAQAAAITQPIRITASGQMLTGSDAGMESSGQLSPAHSRWLMGFPPEWDACAVTAMQSSRKSPPNSSKHSWRPKQKPKLRLNHG